jgi:hypothetical protein
MIADGASARAMPIDTALAATSVEAASAVVAMNCTRATRGNGRSGATRDAGSRNNPDGLNMAVSANQENGICPEARA